MENTILSVSELNALINQTLQMAYSEVVVEGEVSSYKLNQGKWIFFDLKDSDSTISCFMPIYSLKTSVEDGMLIRVRAYPNLTKWGKFSLTVRSIELAGEGNVKKAFEAMRAKFESEGLFAPERKRQLPQYPQKIALITSAQAAAYADFLTILDDRFAGLQIDHMQVQVQGIEASNQITAAIDYFSSLHGQYDVLVMIRGGGSLEDLQAFNSEDVVRAIYGCKIPTLVGIGHETDITLTDLVADLRAATPSDAARLLTADKRSLQSSIDEMINSSQLHLNTQIHLHKSHLSELLNKYQNYLLHKQNHLEEYRLRNSNRIETILQAGRSTLMYQSKLIQTLNPNAILKRGYAIVSSNGKTLLDPSSIKPDDLLMIQLAKGSFNARKIERNPNAKKFKIS